jgi:hypothetical protein
MSEFSGDNREQENQALLDLAELEAAMEVLLLDTEGTCGIFFDTSHMLHKHFPVVSPMTNSGSTSVLQYLPFRPTSPLRSVFNILFNMFNIN